MPTHHLYKWFFTLFIPLMLLPHTSHASPPAAINTPQIKLPTVAIHAGIHKINAEIAATEQARTRGLMFRTTLPGNDGMLFVFEEKTRTCFWMRNTLIPLSIAFIADDGNIVNIENMHPQTEKKHCAIAPVRYALEMRQGWFEKKGIKPGMQLHGMP